MDLLDALAQTFDHTIGVVVNIGRGVNGDELLADMNSLPLEADIGAGPVPITGDAGPTDQLVAFLGRRP